MICNIKFNLQRGIWYGPEKHHEKCGYILHLKIIFLFAQRTFFALFKTVNH